MKKLVNGACYLIVFGMVLIFGTPTLAQWPPSGPDMKINAEIKTQAIDALVKGLKENYVFPDVGIKVAKMLEERRDRGEYNSITSAKEFADLLNKEMAEIAHDKHLHVLYLSEVVPTMPKPGVEPWHPDPRMLMQLKTSNYSFEEVKHLDGNIGYLKLSAFSDAARGGPTVAGAMAFVANTDALIIDLRKNTGGSPTMVDLLASYLFTGDEPVHLNDIEFRKEGTREYTVTQWWILPYVPGQRYVNKEVYVLTSHETPSAAEEFAYDLQVLKRATIVGETTWGGANPGGPAPRLGDHFLVFMPEGQAVNPITKTNWEGVGIKPDVQVPEKEALKTAYRAALQHLIENSNDQQQLNELKKALNNVNATLATGDTAPQ